MVRSARHVPLCSTSVAAIFGLLFLQTNAVQADVPSALAQALFETGRIAQNDGDCEGAHWLFERSQDLEPAVGTQLNLALCDEKMGHLLDAVTRLEAVLGSAAANDPRRPLIVERRAILDRRLARLTILAPDGGSSWESITLDSRQLNFHDFGTEIRLNPGLHKLECSGPSSEQCTRSFSLSEGERSIQAI